MKPKHIDKVNLPNEHKLSAMEMNKERFQPKQCVLTPELVEELMEKHQSAQTPK